MDNVNLTNDVRMGLGTISIGRRWGVNWTQLPTLGAALHLFFLAHTLGIRVFDTAPGYGFSEQRLGQFLKQLDHDQLAQLTVMTKCGVHWDFDRSTDYVDHSYDALCRSIDQSFDRLWKVDVMQLHQASVETLSDSGVMRAMRYARDRGAHLLGASVKTPTAARLAIDNDEIDVIQLPYNPGSPQMKDSIRLAASRDKTIVINRPFGMGKLLDDRCVSDAMKTPIDAFRFILAQPFSGVVLVGTKSERHLQDNARAFQSAFG
ncbi:MAG TPA: aldo/keto reductase [Pirellulaceae bacterium]|nr:aldo/keto reductase [Pirellulaceae bacterium]